MAGTAVDRLPRVLFVLSSATPVLPDGKKSGWYWSELYYPYEEFTKAGCTCDAVSLTGSASPDENSISFLTELMMMEVAAMGAWRNQSHPIHQMLANIHQPSEINPSSYQMIFFVGGHGCCFDLPTAQPIQKLAAEIYEHGGIVAAVCHGPAVLQGLTLSNGQLLINGKQATGFTVEEEEKVGALEWMKNLGKPTMQEIIEHGGGFYSQAGVLKEHVVISDRLLTGQNPTSAGPLANKCLTIWNQLVEQHQTLGNTTISLATGMMTKDPTANNKTTGMMTKHLGTNKTTIDQFHNTNMAEIPNMAYMGDGVMEPSIKQKNMLQEYTEGKQ